MDDISRKGIDITGRYIVGINLGKLGEVLEQEKIYLDVNYRLLDKSGIAFTLWGHRVIIPIFPNKGSYNPFGHIVNVYIKRSGLCWLARTLINRNVLLTKENIVSTLAHEISHASFFSYIEKVIKNKYFRFFIFSIICLLNSIIYFLSPLEISARRFGRQKKNDRRWLECVNVVEMN